MVTWPTISVVMPLYNKERDVARAIESVLAQSVRDWELVIVDDGSEDAGPKVVETFDDPRIRIVSQANAGVSAARNRGIELARSDLIAFLDADDEWQPEFLATVLSLRETFPQCGVFATAYKVCRGKDMCRPAIMRGLAQGFSRGVLDHYFHVAANSDPPLCASAIAVRANALREIGGFPAGINSGEDLLTWAKLALNYKIAYSLEPLASFWAPESVESRPGRVPAIPDQVGNELAKLLEKSRPVVPPGMNEYVALWYRMRAMIFLQLADSSSARAELKRAVAMVGSTARLIALLMVCMLPGVVGRSIYRVYKKVNAYPWWARGDDTTTPSASKPSGSSQGTL